MAYITKEQVADIRTRIKAAYPAKDGWKFSVTMHNHMSVTVAIMRYPSDYDFGETYEQVNHYHLVDNYSGTGKEVAVLQALKDIVARDHWDKSDIQTDYFHCAFYYHLAIGKWDKAPEKYTK